MHCKCIFQINFILKKEFINEDPSSINLFNINYNLIFFSLIRMRIIYQSNSWGFRTSAYANHCLLDHKFWVLSTSSFLMQKLYHGSSSADCSNLFASGHCCYAFCFSSEPSTTLGLLLHSALPQSKRPPEMLSVRMQTKQNADVSSLFVVEWSL